MKYEGLASDPDVLARRIVQKSASIQGASDAAAHAAATEAVAAAAASGAPLTLPQLLALRDREFIDAAYRTILGRDADPAGIETYLGALRRGALTKPDIVSVLRYSPEGLAHAAPIAGLRRRFLLLRLQRTPIIGALIRWATTLGRLPSLVDAARRVEARVEQEALAAELRETRLTAAARAAAAAETEQPMRDVRRTVEGMEMVGRQHQEALRALREQAEALARRVDRDDARIDRLGREIEISVQRLTASNAVMTRQIRDLYTAATRETAAQPAEAAAPSPATPPSASAEDFDGFYLAFEDRLRGSRDEIKRRQAIYLDDAEAARAGTAARPVLDIGCGRGEWLEVLEEHGRIGRGIDVNRAMLAENRQRGLEVIRRDVIDYLAALPAESVGMVTGFHIIEHLPFDVLMRLARECHRVLQPGGCVVFETPNPESLIVGAFTFYYDPTHLHPLPPALTEFLAEYVGFRDVEIRRLHPPEIEEGWVRTALDKWLYNARDYAVIGWKGGRGTEGTPPGPAAGRTAG